MFQTVRNRCRGALASAKCRALVVAASALALAAPVMAQTDPPEMPDIEWPIDPQSIVTKLLAAGGILLGLTFAVVIAFSLIKKFQKRGTASV